MSGAPAHAPAPGHGHDKTHAAPAGPNLALVHTVEHPEDGTSPPKGNLKVAQDGDVPSWKELALSPFKWASKSVRSLLVGAPPAALNVIGRTREQVGGALGTGWGVTKRTGEFIQRNLRGISIEPFGIPLLRTGIVRLDATIYNLCDKQNRTLISNYFAKDLILDRDIKFKKGSYIMGQRPHRGFNWRSVQNRVYGPLERVFDAVTGTEIPVGQELTEDLVVHAGTLIGKGTRLERTSEIMGQAHREMTDKFFEAIIETDHGRFTHNWTLQQPGNRTYRLPQDLKIGVDIANGIGRAFTDPNGRVHAAGANIPAGTVIPAGTEIDNGITIPYNTKILKAEEIDDIPAQRLEKTVALKEKLVLKSPLRVGAPMRINHPFRDNSVTPHVTYAACAWIPTGAVIPTGTTLDKGTKITAGSELMPTVTDIPAGLLHESVMLGENFILPADLRLGADLPQGLTVGFWDYLTPPGGPPTWHAEGTPLPAGTWIPAGTKLTKGTLLPSGSEMPEEFENYDINNPALEPVQLTEAGLPVTRARLRGPKRITGWQNLRRDVRLGEYGLIVPKEFDKQIINPLNNKPYRFEEIPHSFRGHKFTNGEMKYLRVIPTDDLPDDVKRANVLFAGTKLPDGVTISGGSFLDVPTNGAVLPARRLAADFTLMADFTMGGPLKLGCEMANPFAHDVTINKIVYAPGHEIPAGAVLPHNNGATPPGPAYVIPAGTVVPGGSEIITPKIDLVAAVLTARRAAATALSTTHAAVYSEATLRGVAEIVAYQTAINALPTADRPAAQELLENLLKEHITRALITALGNARRTAEIHLRSTPALLSEHDETILLGELPVVAYQNIINDFPADKKEAIQTQFNTWILNHRVTALSNNANRQVGPLVTYISGLLKYDLRNPASHPTLTTIEELTNGTRTIPTPAGPASINSALALIQLVEDVEGTNGKFSQTLRTQLNTAIRSKTGG